MSVYSIVNVAHIVLCISPEAYLSSHQFFLIMCTFHVFQETETICTITTLWESCTFQQTRIEGYIVFLLVTTRLESIPEAKLSMVADMTSYYTYPFSGRTGIAVIDDPLRTVQTLSNSNRISSVSSCQAPIHCLPRLTKPPTTVMCSKLLICLLAREHPHSDSFI